jgi:hypothetical protein
MTQTRRDPAYRRAFGQRLQELVEGHLKVSWGELARQLGYKNDSVLRQTRNGRTCLSVEKLAVFAELSFAPGRISLDWLLAGVGSPLHEPGGQTSQLVARVKTASLETQRTISAYLDVQGAGDSPKA